jgi:hypothetical protein
VEALSYDAADALAVALAEPVPPTLRDRLDGGRPLVLYAAAVLVALAVSGWVALAVFLVVPMRWELRRA